MKQDCVNAVNEAAGRDITQQESKDIESRINAAYRNLARQDPEGWRDKSQQERLGEAAKIAAAQLKAQAEKAKVRVALTIAAHDRTENYFKAAKAAGMDTFEAFQKRLVWDSTGKNVPDNVALSSRIKGMADLYIAKLLKALDVTSPKVFGLFANKEGIKAFTYELFGQDSSPIVGKEMAADVRAGVDSWNKVAEQLRMRFNSAGGEVGKLEDWRIPQRHSQAHVLNAGRDTWVNDVFGKLDRSAYVKEDGNLMTAEEIKKFLGESWLTIATGGSNKANERPVPSGGGSMAARRHAEHRVLHFKDADSYLDYFTKYGEGTPYDAMIHHVETMSRDIGTVEMFGPNPDAQYQLWRQKAEAERSTADAEAGKNNSAIKAGTKLDNLWNYITGKNLPVANKWIAGTFDTLRNWMSVTHMGTATITAVPDYAMAHLTAAFNGLPQSKMLRNEMQAMIPFNKERNALIHRAGLALDTYKSQLNRMGADMFGPRWSSKLATAVIRASGLIKFDDAKRSALGVTMYGSIGKTVKEFKTLADVPEADRRILESKGVTDRDFQVWKKADLEDWGKLGGNTMLTPESIQGISDKALAAIDKTAAATPAGAQAMRDEAAIKLYAHIMQEMDMTVPFPSAREMAQFQGGLQRGTMRGEIVKSFFLFKMFGLTMTERHILRGWNLPTGTGKAAYLATFVAGATLLGSLSLQMKQLLTGKDPQAMNEWKFWAEALLNSGSMGLYGDFLFNTNTQNGNTPMGVFSGPLFGEAEDLAGLTQGNLAKYAQGQPTHAAGDFVHFLKNNTPFQNLWYTKAITDRLIFNQLQEMVSPGAMARMEGKAQSIYHQHYWWRPLEATPQRGPDIGKVIQH